MLDVILKYFGFLRNVPFLPWFVDGLLRAYTAITNPKLDKALDELESQLEQWSGITTTAHKYGGVEFQLHGRELGHAHGNGLVDIRLTRKLREELVAHGPVRPHHVFPDSGWISFDLTPENADTCLELFRLARNVAERKAMAPTRNYSDISG